jgi:hypothetical protein
MDSEEHFDELDHPDWVYKELVENYLPWEEGIKMSFTKFNTKYTLHDSGWIGIFFNVAYEQTATLAIRWDAVWLNDEIAKSTSIVSDWPYLFIQLTNIEQFSTSNYDDIGSLPRSISGYKFEEIDGKKFLKIDDVFGGQINIIYQGEETFLAMEKDKRILSI